MPNIRTAKADCLRGEVLLPGDKSVSHRAIMISSIAKGRSRVSNLLDSLDCRATVDAFRSMGISIEVGKDKTALVEGRGLRGLRRPSQGILFSGNSGTTMRLLLGILAGQRFQATLKGDSSLSARPMKRVTGPLRAMGAEITGRDDANLAPITIKGGELKAIDYKSPIASAQVKSAIILAGLYAEGETRVVEPFKSRDHTEIMLKRFGAGRYLREDALSVAIEGMGASGLAGQSIDIPGDISSAAFFIALAALAEDAEIVIRSCGVNATRSGIISVLQRMGAEIELSAKKGAFVEPCADIIVKSSSLQATSVDRGEIPSMIDEVPIVALCATQAAGRTTIEGIGELRVKETDRVNSTVAGLRRMGAKIESTEDAIIIDGPTPLKGAKVESFGDHRTAMTFAVAGCIASGETTVDNAESIATSFPDFMNILHSLIS